MRVLQGTDAETDLNNSHAHPLVLVHAQDLLRAQQGELPSHTVGCLNVQTSFCVFLFPDAKSAQNTLFNLHWRMGVEAMNWDSVAKKENLDTLTSELSRVEETVKFLRSQLIVLKKQEEAMRDLNGILHCCVDISIDPTMGPKMKLLL